MQSMNKYLEARDQNDRAHRQSLIDAHYTNTLTQERVDEISDEAIMWARLVFLIHSDPKKKDITS